MLAIEQSLPELRRSAFAHIEKASISGSSGTRSQEMPTVKPGATLVLRFTQDNAKFGSCFSSFYAQLENNKVSKFALNREIINKAI